MFSVWQQRAQTHSIRIQLPNRRQNATLARKYNEFENKIIIIIIIINTPVWQGASNNKNVMCAACVLKCLGHFFGGKFIVSVTLNLFVQRWFTSHAQFYMEFKLMPFFAFFLSLSLYISFSAVSGAAGGSIGPIFCWRFFFFPTISFMLNDIALWLFFFSSRGNIVFVGWWFFCAVCQLVAVWICLSVAYLAFEIVH